MPICANPDATTPVWLEVDKDIPLEKRPVFTSKFITRRKRLEVNRLCKEAGDLAISDATTFELLMRAIRIGIIGWKNFVDGVGKPLEFTDDNVSDQLTGREIWELARNYPVQLAVSERELGESHSPSPSNAKSDAPDASAKPASENATS